MNLTAITLPTQPTIAGTIGAGKVLASERKDTMDSQINVGQVLYRTRSCHDQSPVINVYAPQMHNNEEQEGTTNRAGKQMTTFRGRLYYNRGTSKYSRPAFPVIARLQDR